MPKKPQFNPESLCKKPAGRRLKIGYITQHAYDGVGLQLITGVSEAAKDFDLNLISMVGGFHPDESASEPG